ncbi:MAG: hypothetical protein ACI8SE_000650 [Bacteroidia bacterium]|jgi:hypothetical protein
MKVERRYTVVIILMTTILLSCNIRGKKPMVSRKYKALACPDFLGDVSDKSHDLNPSYDLISDYEPNSDAIRPKLTAGTLTATEINDFAKWDLWEDISGSSLADFSGIWSMLPKDRVTVIVSRNNRPIPNQQVSLYDSSDQLVWKSVTDNTGRAELWVNMFDEGGNASYVMLGENGIGAMHSNLKRFDEGVNHIECNADCNVTNQLDLLFMVDATGSMGDEINHLKSELTDIVGKVISNNPKLEVNLGSIFYKCVGNSYTTLKSSFSTDIDSTVRFIRNQAASEGGDEAVEIALHEAINDYKWNDGANARLLVMVLDETPNDSTDRLLKKSIMEAAAKGIKIIPVVASGVSGTKDKSLEYLMRCCALATGGTNAFLTDHSGVGNAHTAPTTDTMQIELLNQLLIRVISQYSYIPECDEKIDVELEVKGTSEIQITKYELVVKDTTESDITIANQKSNSTVDVAKVDSIRFEKVITQRVALFPNPVASMLNVSSSFEIESLFVFDSNGKIVQRKQLNSKLGSIDLSHYPNGHYYIGCLYEDQWYKSKLVVVH